ncbi:hypothetical protein T484DRAFT_1855187 [Baffinella frigidus]|nr:hypothetical protein T484DRAFT_1855187 [Cryptophyta sp. CCMP2293]
MTTFPHNPMIVADDFLLRAVHAVAAEQGFQPEHPPASHDAFLARRHAKRLPCVSSTKLTSSFDLPAPADGTPHHNADDGCERDERTSSDADPPSSCTASPDPPRENPTPDRRPTDHCSMQGTKKSRCA